MFADVLQVIAHPITALIAALVLGAVAMSGKFSLRVAACLLFLAGAIGLFGVWGSDTNVALKVSGSIVLIGTLVGIGWWVHQPKETVSVKVSDIQVTQLPKHPGDMLIAQAFYENVSGRTVPMRNIVWAQTRTPPSTLQDEKAIEDELWKIVSESLQTHGRDAEMPSAGGGR